MVFLLSSECNRREIQHHAPGCPFIIVGTKSDMRNDEEVLASLKVKGISPIDGAQGQQLCNELGGYGYLECSALTQSGLKTVFDEAIRCVLKNDDPKPRKKRKCAIL